MKAMLVSPRGFCAGVRRAIDIVDLALEKFPAPIYVRKEIVHNKHVVEDFKKRGVIFIDEVAEAPAGATVVFSAHGIAPSVRDDAKDRRLKTIDATCPLVTKVHLEVHRFLREDFTLLLIGHKHHDEVVGTMGEAPGKIQLVETEADVALLKVPDPSKVMVLTQTTLSVDETRGILEAIRRRFPKAQTPPKDDICYATQNRQDAVRELLNRKMDVLLVVGSKNSSNSQRLCDVARESGADAYLIDNAGEIQESWVKGKERVGITAGASAPEHLVQEVVDLLRNNFGADVEDVFVREENVVFSLPKELTAPVSSK
jgi:4-hydroxy-3-methylbut-2-en-1-yl diphosphate reductase